MVGGIRMVDPEFTKRFFKSAGPVIVNTPLGTGAGLVIVYVTVTALLISSMKLLLIFEILQT
jgi:hypothetical protein